MGLLNGIKHFLFPYLKVKVSDVKGIVDSIDVDKDGYISAGELVGLIKSVRVKK